MIEFSTYYTERVNEYLARGLRPYKAEREAYEIARAAVDVGTVKPPPADWDEP